MKYIFFTNALLLISAGIAIFTNHNGLAEKIFLIVFLFMIIGSFFYVKEIRGE